MKFLAAGFLAASLTVIEASQHPLKHHHGDAQPYYVPHPRQNKGPTFAPPNAGSSTIKCQYPTMTDWEPCSSASDRTCWLRHKNGTQFDINSDYESVAPVGITRKYNLDASDMSLSPDGIPMLYGQVYNKQFPGPLIEACWGDTIQVTVTNHLKYNGTTVHWHGMRQLGTNEMDGVNGITQCGIAPGDSMTYTFAANQYGMSWYHSHYSLQYANGALGLMALYGPSSAAYDLSINPISIQDWDHRSAFQDFYVEIGAKPKPGAPNALAPANMTTVLINGTGYYQCTPQEAATGNCGNAPAMYQTVFQKGKKHLMRIINTSQDSLFVFSIDNHQFQVVSTDFVPIEPYNAVSVNIGIGQRYDIIVDGTPTGSNIPSDGNFWIRMDVPHFCGTYETQPDNRQGIVRYNSASKAAPTSSANNYQVVCADENASNLVPVVKWQVGQPANDDHAQYMAVDLTAGAESVPHGGFARWAMGNDTMWLNYTNPTILNLGNAVSSFSSEKVVIAEDYTSADWIYFIISDNTYTYDQNFVNRTHLPLVHPIHLHGHDFALMQQSYSEFNGELDLNLNNPPRRDTALLPQGGFIALAYKSDNPGIWIMHCHIAAHVAAGLAVQIMENQKVVQQTYTPSVLSDTSRVCKNFNTWYSDKNNWWNPAKFQDDSGV